MAEKEDEKFDVLAALSRNRARLEKTFNIAQKKGAIWLVECRDLFDALESDAGVYFIRSTNDAKVDELVRKCSNEDQLHRVLGIFSLLKPLIEQDSGLTSADWLSGRR